MRMVSVVPARSGSKSIRDKNLQIVRGHSLIGWAVTIGSKIFDCPVFIDTDSSDYAAEGESYGAIAPFLRHPDLAKDTTSDTEAFSEFATRMAFPDETVIIHLRPTSPLRTPGVVIEAVNQFRNNIEDWSSLRSIHEMAESSYKTFEVSPEGQLLPLGALVGDTEQSNLPRQSFPTTYIANGYVDIFKVSNIAEFGSIHGPRIHSFITKACPEVDSQHELDLIQILSENNDFDELVSEMDRKVSRV